MIYTSLFGMKYLITSLLIFLASTAFSQDLFIKSYQAIAFQNQETQIEMLQDGHYVIAGFSNSTSSLNKVFVRKYNPCGEEVWSVEIFDNNFNINLVGLNIDSNQHILISGIYDEISASPRPYLVKLNTNGNLIFSKLISSTLNYNTLIYSSAVAANGDYLLYGLYHYTASPPNNQQISIIRLNANGNIKWTKNYNFNSFSWGRMIATKDNGALAKTSNTIFKVDSLGAIVWAKNFNNLGSLLTPIETDTGFVFMRYYIGGIDRGAAFSIKHDGNLKWFTNNFFTFFPHSGITRKSGNVLFVGSNHFSNNRVSFLELDYKNGNILRRSQFQSPQLDGISASDLAENKKAEIYFTGADYRGVVQQLTSGKLDDTLSVSTCSDPLSGSPTDPYFLQIIGDNPVSDINNTDLSSSTININIQQIALATSFPSCSYTKARGNYKLGKDTSLCIGQSIILGNINSDFDAYLWSTGSTNKTIGVNQQGTYWLQVVSACDTLRDSIQVSYTPGILFNLGPDTTSCKDSILLGANLSPSLSYLWSTGETSQTISVKNPGVYWVEHSNKCHTHRDSIQVFFETVHPAINLGKDTILCPKQGLTLGDINSPYDQFLWSDGSQNKVLNVFTAGTYWLEASGFCNSSSDTIKINYYPDIGLDLGPDKTICHGGATALGISKVLPNYLWSTGQTTPSIVVSVPGLYWLETQTNCGAVRDSIRVDFIPKISAPNLGNDTSLCFGETLELQSNSAQFKWSTGETTTTIYAKNGWYWLEYLNQCDTIRDSILIEYFPEISPIIHSSKTRTISKDTLIFKNLTLNGINPIWNFGDGEIVLGDTVEHVYKKAGNYTVSLSLTSSEGCLFSQTVFIIIEPTEYFVPNIFSPNNDGINDLFFPIGDDIKNYSIVINNRWGEVVFDNKNVPWAGRDLSSNKLSEGVYFYQVEIELHNDFRETLKGSVVITR